MPYGAPMGSPAFDDAWSPPYLTIQVINQAGHASTVGFYTVTTSLEKCWRTKVLSCLATLVVGMEWFVLLVVCFADWISRGRARAIADRTATSVFNVRGGVRERNKMGI